MRRPRKCPRCGSERIARILYGLPALSDALREELETRRTVPGGCIVTGNDPRWRCTDCGNEMGHPRGASGAALPDDDLA
jgi:ribosomal protein L37AE/L43A